MKKIAIVSLFILLILTVTSSAFAADLGTELNFSNSKINLNAGVTLSATNSSVSKTGSTLNNDCLGTNCSMIKNMKSIIEDATFTNDRVAISGQYNNIRFQIEGEFCGISENGNVIVFKVEDICKNYRVAYCAVEKNIVNSSLYFKSFSDNNKEYNVVTKLYLVAHDNDEEYIMTEIYGNGFPTISKDAIAKLPEDHYLSLFWYAREFEPSDISTAEEMLVSRSGNVSYGQLESYTFNFLGMEIKHYLRHWQDCDIRDVTANQTSSASATLRISEKWIEAPLANDCSSTTSTLSLKNVSIIYLTRTNTAVTEMQTTGTITQNGAIVSSFKYGLGVGLKGLSATASLSFTWEPGNDNKDTGVYYQAHTNTSANGYWREAEGRLKSNQYLNSIGNNYVTCWNYASYTSATSTANASIVFKYYVDNLLDYAQGHSETDVRTFPVNIT